jgi:serine/threonine-protein kinase HipA
MTGTAEVRIWGQKAGAISWDRNRRQGSFQFFPDFFKNGWDLSPIQMPVSNPADRIYSFPGLNEETYRGLPGLLADSLPDEFGNRIIDQWLAVNNLNRSEFSPVDRLCYTGERGMGAMEYHPVIKEAAGKLSEVLEMDRLVEFAGKVLQRRKKFETDLKDEKGFKELIRVGTSAGGQRPKAIIAFNEKTLQVRSGQVPAPPGFEHWIIKLDGVAENRLKDPKGYGRIEYAYYLMALDCGINISESRLFEEGGRAHFMTKRFDRRGNAEKIHMQTLCATAHFDYKSPGAYSYENAFEIMRQLKLPYLQTEQLFRRMVFNIIARNQDDHTKNIAFLMDRSGEWKLSPAYDLTYAFNPSGIWTHQHQMSVNGKRDGFDNTDLITTGEKLNLKKSKEILEEITMTIANWDIYSKTAGIPKLQATLVKKVFRMEL